MSELTQLVDTANKLSNTLSAMAADERRFGHMLCHQIEQISYDVYKTAQELKELSTYTLGV